MSESPRQYETHRALLQVILSETCVKQSKDGGTLSYDWSTGKYFSAIEKKLPDLCGSNGRLPEGLKTIARFEFNKLKETVMSNPDWVHTRSSHTYALSIDGIEGRRRDMFANTNLPIAEQLRGAQILLERVNKQLDKLRADGDEEMIAARNRLSKRQARLLREVNFLRQTQQDIADAQKEAQQADAATVPA